MRFIRDIILKYTYLLVIVLALILRTYNLNLNPVGITHDEIHDLINAKSLASTGQNTPGTVAGIFTKNGMCDGNCIFGELASFILIPWMKIVPLDIIWSKIPFLLAALGIVYFGGKLFENLSGKRSVGGIAGLLLAINPWAIHFGRTALENLLAFGFYLAGLYFFTKEKMSGKDYWLGLVVMILGSLSYMGAKPLFPFLIVLVLVYRFLFDKKKQLKQSLIILGVAIIFFGSYWKMLSVSMAGKRLIEVGGSGQLIKSTVDEERRISLEIPILRDVVINKIWIRGRVYLDKYFKAYAPENIFFQSDLAYDAFNIPGVGYLYLMDFIFVILGLVYYARTNLKKTYWLLVLLAIMPIASVISDYGTTFALRSGLLYPLLVGLSAIGIEGLYGQLGLKFKKIFLIGVVVIYGLFFGYFEIMYMYRTPMAKSGAWFQHERLLIKYLDLLTQKTDNNVVVVLRDRVDVMYLYGFYTKKYNDKVFIEKFNKNLSEKRYEIDNIKFVEECPKNQDKNVVYLFQKEMDCVDEPNNLTRISELRDAGAKFFIPKDVVCGELELNKYLYPRELKSFDIEKMNQEEFCKLWITKP